MSDHHVDSAKKYALSHTEDPSLLPSQEQDFRKRWLCFIRQILDTQGIQGPRFIIELGTAASKLELGKGLLGAGRLGHLQGVVLHSLAQGPEMKSFKCV